MCVGTRNIPRQFAALLKKEFKTCGILQTGVIHSLLSGSHFRARMFYSVSVFPERDADSQFYTLPTLIRSEFSGITN